MIVHPQYSRCLSQNYVVKAHEDKPNRNYKQLDNINLILPSNFLFKKFKKIVGKRTSYSDLSVIACGRHCGTSSSAFKLEFYPTKLNMQMTLRSFLAVLDVFTSISVKTTTLFWQWVQQTSATAQVFFFREWRSVSTLVFTGSGWNLGVFAVLFTSWTLKTVTLH